MGKKAHGSDASFDAESLVSEIPLIDLPAFPDREKDTRKTLRADTLARNTHSSWYFLVHGAVDAVLTLGPAFFFVLAGLCIGQNGKPVSSHGDNIKAITLLSPTIFPIVYAAILGKLLRRLGLYKAERGITIGNLERLIGCQSIFSALERQIGLQRFDLLGIFILLAWLLSPLGGQASLRLLSTMPMIKRLNTTVLYCPIEAYPSQTALSIGPSNTSVSPFFASLFVTAIQISRNRTDNTMDIFGNVRIPDFNTLLGRSSAQIVNTTWFPIDGDTETSYVSVFGIPVIDLPESGNVSFQLVSHYWAVDCPSSLDATTKQRINPWQKMDANTTYLPEIKPLSPSFVMVVYKDNSTDSKISFQYVSRRQPSDYEIGDAISLTCAARPLIVESRVACRDRSCSVVAMRHVDQALAELWKPSSPLSVFEAISNRLPGSDISATQDIDFGSELVERWILNPDLDFSALGAGYVDLSAMDSGVFRQRLQMAINTFWDATVGSTIRIDGIRTGSLNRLDGGKWLSTTVYVTEDAGMHYDCHIIFAALTMVISAVLLLAANLSMLLGLITRTPDFLGFVSSSARENPYLKGHVPFYLSGVEAARLLRDVQVRVGDVGTDAEIGHIALATMDAGPKKLRWSRLYE